MTDYITLEQLKADYIGAWKDEWDAWAARQITLASSWLRTYFQNADRDLDQELLDGDLEPLTVEMAVSGLVLQKLSSTVNVPFGGDFTQLSESAGPYQTSVTMNPRSTSFYLRDDMRKLFGFSNGGFKVIQLEL